MSLLPPILLVDDNADDRELLSLVLRGAFGEVLIEEAADAAGLGRALAAGRFGAVLTEHELSWIRSGDLLRLLHDLRPGCPVLVVSVEEIAFSVEETAFRSKVGGAQPAAGAVPIRGSQELPPSRRSRLESRSRSAQPRVEGAALDTKGLIQAEPERPRIRRSRCRAPSRRAASGRAARAAAARTGPAIAQFEEVIRLEPGDAKAAKAHHNLGILLASTGRAAEAIPHFEAAVGLAPDCRDAAENLSRARDLATVGQVAP